MTDETTPESNPITQPENPTGKPKGKKYNPIKKAKSPTDKKPVQHNKIKQEELVKWTVFVQEETKTAVGKAVAKAGTTVTDWVDSRLRQAATDELTHRAKPPAKPADVADLMSQFEKRFADQQAEAARVQGEQLQQLAETINSQPANLKEWLFGKPKKG